MNKLLRVVIVGTCALMPNMVQALEASNTKLEIVVCEDNCIADFLPDAMLLRELIPPSVIDYIEPNSERFNRIVGDLQPPYNYRSDHEEPCRDFWDLLA